MRSRNLFAIFALTSLLIATLAEVHADDQVYRWVDAEGVAHYSDSPPDDAPVSEGDSESIGTPHWQPPAAVR